MQLNGSTRLLVFDLDGTLLDPSHQIPKQIPALTRRLRDLGIETTIATGRPFSAVESFIRQLELTLPVITFNGAAITTTSGIPLATRPLPRQHARSLLERLTALGTANHLYLRSRDDFFYTDRSGPEADYIKAKDGLEYRCVEDLAQVLTEANGDPVKMFSIGARDRLILLQDDLAREPQEMTCVFSEHDMLEFLGPQVNKGTALALLCERLGMPTEQVCAFGDNMNDLEMLQLAGTGVAMREAPTQLQEAADWVIDDIGDFLAHRF